jgi:TPR repeat protein
MRGLGVKQDVAAAIKLFEHCAEQGAAGCSYELAMAYMAGNGVKKDESKALSLFKHAGMGGNGASQLIVGERYLKGQDGSPDLEQARKWLRWAAYSGETRAVELLVDIYKTASAAKPDVELAVTLGDICLHGKGLVRNHAMAAAWFQKAADLGSRLAMNNLGDMYENGQGEVGRNLEKALDLYRKSAELGEGLAFFSLGTMYEEGHGVSKSLPTAYAYYLLAQRFGYRSGNLRKGILQKALSDVDKKQAEQVASAWKSSMPLPK